MVLLSASAESEFEPAFASAVRQRADALLVSAVRFHGPACSTRHSRRHAMPRLIRFENADAGGLMSYGPSIADVYRLIGRYASRILKGDNGRPSCTIARSSADPQPQDRQGARLEIPPTLLARATRGSNEPADCRRSGWTCLPAPALMR
jgi:putative ABC transport system substrate-binding protein